MLLINLAAALFCAASITASPTAPQYEALAERDVAGTELESRTFWRNDGECKDWWRNKLCRLKGRYWSCNAHCECVYNPPEKQCHEWVKHDCENRAKTNLRLWFDPKECKCVDRGCPQEHKDKCLHEGGTYNDHECKCTPKPTCPEHVKKECEARQSPRFEFNQHECKCVDKGCPQEHKDKCLHEGGTYNDHECKCTPKPACPEHVKRECEARQSPRFEFNQHECKCVDKGCPREHKEKCLHEGGTYNDHECKCTPKPACPAHVKQECEARKSPRFEFNQHECKCIDKGCPREHKEKCLQEGGTYNDHECKCTPKPACPEHVKQECEARKSPRFEFNQHECKCIDKGCPREHKEKCLHEGGTYNDHECKCTHPPPTCRNEHKKRECEQWGGNWNAHECKCAPKEHEPCKEWKKVLLCKKLGKGCNDRCRCT